MKRRNREKIFIASISVFFVLLVSLGIFFYLKNFTTTTISDNTKATLSESPTKFSYYNNVTINLPAIDQEGKGAIVKLEIQAIPGQGRTLVNVDNILFWVDTQYSIRTAKFVAENITNLDLSNVDLVYNIETNASVIEGQSAGAALTVGTVAVLENKTLNKDVIITGTIDSNGRIGPVGGIIGKATAAKDAGATLFLVPPTQGTQVNYSPEQTCENVGPMTFCRTQYKQIRVDVSKDVGIEVKEVSTIQEALKYFLT
jgi:uncharacterized protein